MMRRSCLGLSLLCLALGVGADTLQPQPYCLVQDDRIDFMFGVFGEGAPAIASYRCGTKLAKPHFHPLQVGSPQGADLRLTRAFPMEAGLLGETSDHPHHRGLWFCHGDVSADGYTAPIKIPNVAGVDLWSEGVGRGRIVCTQVGRPRGLTAQPWIESANEWRGPDGVVLLKEDRRFRLTGRLLLSDSTLTAADKAIIFGDTKEGSFAVRVNDQFCEKRGGLIRNSAGKKTEKECWGQLADWCDYSGKVDGEPCGLTIFDHPENSARACWHVRAYGLMAANPFGRAKSGFPAMKGRTDLVKLKPGESLRLRYGVLLYAGEKKPEEIQKEYEAFVKLAK